jgi:rod shape-determining protein MreC
MKLFSPRSLRTATLVIIVVGLLILALGGYLNPLFRVTLNPLVAVQTFISSRFMALYDFLTIPRDVTSLRQRNSELEAEAAQMRTQVIELQQKLSEAQVLYALLDFARARPENQYVAASVIGRDANPFLRYVLIDQGSDAGIRHGMPVVTQEGLVGRIDAVTAGAARVQLITDAGCAVNIHLQSSQTEAVLSGSLTGELTLEMLPQDINISTGEVVLTSGLGGNYPPNIFIGQVSGVRNRENELFRSATVQPVVDFAGLKAVLVITNFRPVDIAPLIPPSNP